MKSYLSGIWQLNNTFLYAASYNTWKSLCFSDKFLKKVSQRRNIFIKHKYREDGCMKRYDERGTPSRINRVWFWRIIYFSTVHIYIATMSSRCTFPISVFPLFRSRPLSRENDVIFCRTPTHYMYSCVFVWIHTNDLRRSLPVRCEISFSIRAQNYITPWEEEGKNGVKNISKSLWKKIVLTTRRDTEYKSESHTAVCYELETKKNTSAAVRTVRKNILIRFSEK